MPPDGGSRCRLQVFLSRYYQFWASDLAITFPKALWLLNAAIECFGSLDSLSDAGHVKLRFDLQ